MNQVRPLTGWLMLALASLVLVFLDELNSVASIFNRGTAAFRRAEYALFLGSALIAASLFARRRWFFATLCLIPGTLLPLYLSPLIEYVNSLGRDSLVELQGFDWAEAGFYLSTMQAFMQPVVGRRVVALYLAMTVLVLLAVYVLCSSTSKRSSDRIHVLSGLTLIGCSLAWIGVYALSPFRFHWQTHEHLVENFRNPPFALGIANRGLKLVIYIGESTTSMNMGLYGYPRETSPALLDLKRRRSSLLVFDNVLATHTHTAPSLLEALSVPIDSKENFLDIYSRRRISLIPILKASGVGTRLISNQGATGFSNLASSIIFGEADSRHHSTASERFGDLDYRMVRPFDHEFLLPNLAIVLSEGEASRASVVFLHSYAGHGGYLDYIPQEYREPVDEYLRPASGVPLLDGAPRLTQEVEAYDSAVRYIDSVVSGAIEAVARVTDPVVFIYFSDHGESVYTGRGHDSAQYIHEMVRVPFLMYFNEAAVAAYPALFGKYSALSAQRNVATLAQLPSTILDLLGADIQSRAVASFFSKPIGENNKGALMPIVARRVGHEIRYVALDYVEPPVELDDTFVDTPDAATRTFVATRRDAQDRPRICYRTSEKLPEALRGSFVADCLHVDITVDDTGRVVPKSASRASRIPLQRFEEIAERRNVGLWLSADIAHSGPWCRVLEKQLGGAALARTPRLVEFTAPVAFDDERWLNCVRGIQNKGIAVALRLDPAAVQTCSKALGGPDKADPARECEPLSKSVQAAHDKGFDRFSFDYTGSLALLQHLDPQESFRWIARRFDLRPPGYTTPDRVETVMVDPH